MPQSEKERMMLANPWVRSGFDAWSLGVEASSVTIGSGGEAAETEVRLMVSEKIAAGFALQVMALTGGLGLTLHGATRKALAHYRGKVRANRRRLAKR
jgi:hypothetical protein